MNQLFITFAELSIKLSVIIIVLLIIRQCTPKLPKIFHYSLWCFVLLGMIPFSYTSSVSIQNIPLHIEEVLFQSNIHADALVQEVNGSSITMVDIVSALWLSGIVLFGLFYLISYLRIKKITRFAIRREIDVFESDEITSPFLFGLFHPKIYLPTTINDETREHILAHELMHKHRKDYLTQCIANIILALNWYNIIIWIGYYSFIQDLEFSCDECVLKERGLNYKSNFAHSILDMVQYHNFMALSLKSSNTKKRIVHILNYRKPSVKISLLCLILGLCLSIPLLSQPEIISAEPILPHQADDSTSSTLNTALPTEIQQETTINDEESLNFTSPMNDYAVTCGWLCYEGHYAYDIRSEVDNAKIYAVEDAVVQVAGYDEVFGNYIILEHSGGYTSFYGHLSSINVTSGDSVKQADIIASQGATGQTAGDHLHFYITKDNVVLENSLELTQ